MPDRPEIKPDYTLAKCCNPSADDRIIGFLKTESGVISVHIDGCENLRSIQPERLVSLEWRDIYALPDLPDQKDIQIMESLDNIDISILRHHEKMGFDYAAVVAKAIGAARAKIFERHRKLRDLNLLSRVEPTMIQYRKGFTKNKWIKHRNHTYYEITARGREILETYKDRDQ